MAMATFLYALGGYLAGSVPFAVVVSRALGLPDPRTYGSGNIGATNVLRSGNRLAAFLILIARHRDNIAKLTRGEESRIGEKKGEAPGASPQQKVTSP